MIATANTSAGTQTLTLNYLVAGTDAPAYSNPIATGISWPRVVTPDMLNDREATAGNGPYYQLSLATGELQTSHEIPSYNPNVAPFGLVYSSTAAHLQPIFIEQYQLPNTNMPATVKATLSLNGTAYATPASYSTAGFNPGDILEIALQTDASSLGTGRYPYTISLTDGNNNPLLAQSGSVDLVNEGSSSFGPGWSLDNEQRLWPVTGQGVLLELPGGRSLWFTQSGGSYTAPAGEFSTFSYNSSTDVYTDTLPDGTQYNFAPAGANSDTAGSRWLTSVVDRTGTALTYGYTASPNNPRQLVSLTDFNNQTTTLTYTNGRLATITDPATRTATLGYDGSGRLTTIEDFDMAVWTYAYDSANHLTDITDPRQRPTGISYTTGVSYDPTSGRATQVGWPDGVTEYLGALQLVGLGESGATPTAALAVQALATFSDGDGNTWEDYLDWYGFGSATEEQVPTFTYTYVTYRGSNDLPWLTADPLAHRYRYIYDGNGNPTQIVYPSNAVATYAYNTFSEPTAFTDQNNKQTQLAYDGSGNLLSSTDALSHVTSFTYTLHGLLASIEDANTRTSSFGYDSLFRLQTVTEPFVAAAGKSYSVNYGYDSAGNRTTEKDARGNTVTMTYDPMGRLVSERFPDTGAATYTFSYDSAGNLSGIEDPLTHVTTYNFDQENRLFSITDPLGNEFSWEHDGLGNVVTYQDALPTPRTHTIIHDQKGDVIAEVKADKTVKSFSLDASGRVLNFHYPVTHGLPAHFHVGSYGYAVLTSTLYNDPTTYDFLIATESFTWTPDDQLASETDPMGENLSYQYDSCDCLTGVSDNGNGSGTGPGARVTSYGRDPVHRVTSITDPLSNVTSFGYDPVGNRVTVTDALLHVTSFGYDELNRLTSVTVSPSAGVNLVTTYGYDENGNRVSVEDPLMHVVTYVYDARNRLVGIQQSPNGTTLATTTINYDTASREISVQDPDGNTTTYGYDNADRLTSEMTTFGTRSYVLDNDGEVTQYTDRNGRVLSFSYDVDGNLVQEQWYNGSTLLRTATYAYYDTDWLMSAQDPNSTYTIGFDLAGKLSSVDNQGTPTVPHVVLSYSYDYFSMPATMSDNLGGALTYIYDAANRLTYESLAVSGTQGPQVTLGYDAGSRLTSIQRQQSSTGPSITSTYAYDNANRLTSIAHTSSAAGTLSNFNYAYDAASRVTTYSSSLPGLTENLHYTYDNTNQLLSVSGTHTENYGYDLNGNRTMSGYATTYQNRMTQAVEANGVTYNYAYDNDGNMLTKVGTEGGQLTTYAFSWDYHNRLTNVTVTRGGTTAYNVTYTYDVFDRRIGQQIQNGAQSSQIWTVYNGANPYADFNGSGTLTNRYLYGDGMDSLLAKDSAANTVSWYLEDGLGSVCQVVQTDGVSGLDNITYDSFGNVLTESNAANGDRFKFTAREWDANTGLQYNRARYYDPGAGRWISEDPIGYAGDDTNLYRYGANDPVSNSDPSGTAILIRDKETFDWFTKKLQDNHVPYVVRIAPDANGNVVANIIILSCPKDFKVPDGDNPDWWDRVFQEGRRPGATKDGKPSDEMLLVKPGGNLTFVKPEFGEDLRKLFPGEEGPGDSSVPFYEDPFVWAAFLYAFGPLLLARLGRGAVVTGEGMSKAAIMRAFFTGQKLARTEANISALRWYLQVARDILARYATMDQTRAGVIAGTATQTQRIQQILEQLRQWGIPE